eukprot:2661430-Prymnesium_polylepis.1
MRASRPPPSPPVAPTGFSIYNADGAPLVTRVFWKLRMGGAPKAAPSAPSGPPSSVMAPTSATGHGD